MTRSEKTEIIMKQLEFTQAEFKALITPDENNRRFNKLFKLAQRKLDEAADIQIRQHSTVSLS